MVRRVFGFYLLRSIYGELRDRSHHTIVYFDLSFLHCLEDTKRYKDKATGNWVLSQVIKIRLIGNCFFGLLHLVFGLVFCSLWFLWVWVYWGREKREKEKSAVILRSASFSFCPLSVALYTIERVLLSDAPSPLPLSPCSLSDPTSTSI